MISDFLGSYLTQIAYFSLLKNTKKLSLMTFCDTTAEIGVSFWIQGNTHRRTDGQTDMRDEIII